MPPLVRLPTVTILTETYVSHFKPKGRERDDAKLSSRRGLDPSRSLLLLLLWAGCTSLGLGLPTCPSGTSARFTDTVTSGRARPAGQKKK